MPIAPLRVQMLGGFTIRREDAEASVNQRSRKLCLLLCHTSRKSEALLAQRRQTLSSRRACFMPPPR